MGLSVVRAGIWRAVVDHLFAIGCAPTPTDGLVRTPFSDNQCHGRLTSGGHRHLRLISELDNAADLLFPIPKPVTKNFIGELQRPDYGFISSSSIL